MMFHSNLGSQYGSWEFGQALWRSQCIQSMIRRGNHWDNAPMARLFRSLKTEWGWKRGYRNLADVKLDVGSYLMGCYNRQWPHSYNGYLPPVISEELLAVSNS